MTHDPLVTCGIWRAASVGRQPLTTLIDWRVFEVKLALQKYRTRHFVGRSVESGYHGRTSSPVEQFDVKERCGITRSGRVYLLMDAPGFHPDADFTWQGWISLNRATDIVELTAELYEEMAAHF